MSRMGKVARSLLSLRAMRSARAMPTSRVLVLGVFLLDKANVAPEIVMRLQSRRHQVDHRWACVGKGDSRKDEMRAHIALEFDSPVPKFTIINRLLSKIDLRAYDYVIISDDDIELAPGFLDEFLGLQAYCGFSLAQPARSQLSNVDHPVTLESHARIARQTRFVEIGPLFSIASAAYPHLLPFDESFYMGWGLDHVWPVTLERAGLSQGIIDITPLHHRMRPVATTYSGAFAQEQMSASLRGRESIHPLDRVRPLRTIWW